MLVEENVQAGEPSQLSEEVEDVEENLNQPEEPEEAEEEVIEPEEAQEEVVEPDPVEEEVEEQEVVDVADRGDIEELPDEVQEQEGDHDQEAVEVSDVEMQGEVDEEESAEDEHEQEVGEEEMVVVTDDDVNAPNYVLNKEDEEERDDTTAQLHDSDQPQLQDESDTTNIQGEPEEVVENDIKPEHTPDVVQLLPLRQDETQTKEDSVHETKPQRKKNKSKVKELTKLDETKNLKDVNGGQKTVQKEKRKPDGLREGSTVSEGPGVSAIKVSILYSQSEGRVLFLEAGKDFVDLLMNLLLLPIGCIVKLLRDNKADLNELGAIVRLFQSVEKMERPIMLVEKDVLMKPQSVLNERPLSPQVLNGYVKDSLVFTITDELDVFPSSTIKSIALLNKLHVENMADLKILEVPVDTTKDVLRLLRASLISKSVLNHVFRSRLPTYNQEDQ